MTDDLSLNGNGFKVTDRVHQVLSQLSGRGENQALTAPQAPFKTIKDAFLMAVYLEAMDPHPRPLEGKTVEVFKGTTLQPAGQDFLRSIAVGYSGGIEILSEPSKVAKLSEELANAGAMKLESIAAGDEEKLWNMTDFFLREFEDKEPVS
jgi:hypothetical protein